MRIRKSSSRNPIVYGRDEYHGRSGPENPSPGSGFATPTGAQGSGYELIEFRGMFLDKLSIEEILDDEAAEESTRQDKLDREFLSSMGFITDGTTLK